MADARLRIPKIRKPKAKGLPKRYANTARVEKRRRYFARHGQAYTGR